MMRVATLLIVFVTSAAVQAEQAAPSPQVLADMGLAGLQVLTDAQAAAIRGRGFEPGSQLDGFEHYQQSKIEFKERVAEFRHRIKHHTFAGKEGFQESIVIFHHHVKKFHEAVKAFKHKIH
jgi:hypothetical protein